MNRRETRVWGWLARWAVASVLGAFAVSKLRLGIEPRAPYGPWVQWSATGVEALLAIACVATCWRWPLGLAAVFASAATFQAARASTSAAPSTCGCLGQGIAVSPGQRALLAGTVVVAAVIALLVGERSDDASSGGADHAWRAAVLGSTAYLLSVGLQALLAP